MHKVIRTKRNRGWLISFVCLATVIVFFVLSRLDTYGLDRSVVVN